MLDQSAEASPAPLLLPLELPLLLPAPLELPLLLPAPLELPLPMQDIVSPAVHFAIDPAELQAIEYVDAVAPDVLSAPAQ